MTPEEARDLLDGTTPGPWEWADGKDNDVEYEALRGPGGVNALRTQDAEEYASWIVGTNANKALAAAAPTLAAMIAGMREEWGVHVTGYPKNIADWWEICDGPADSTEWFADEEAAEAFATEREDEGFNTRIVRRYVTETEEIE